MGGHLDVIRWSFEARRFLWLRVQPLIPIDTVTLVILTGTRCQDFPGLVENWITI